MKILPNFFIFHIIACVYAIVNQPQLLNIFPLMNILIGIYCDQTIVPGKDIYIIAIQENNTIVVYLLLFDHLCRNRFHYLPAALAVSVGLQRKLHHVLFRYQAHSLMHPFLCVGRKTYRIYSGGQKAFHTVNSAAERVTVEESVILPPGILSSCVIPIRIEAVNIIAFGIEAAPVKAGFIITEAVVSTPVETGSVITGTIITLTIVAISVKTVGIETVFIKSEPGKTVIVVRCAVLVDALLINAFFPWLYACSD